jgi:Ca-activated chloride channel family protein
MEFTNINIFSVSIFIIILLIISFLAYKKYFAQLNFNNKYKLLASEKLFYFKYIFLIFSIFILLFSILWLKWWEKENSTKVEGIDVMFVLDVSKSMNVADISDWYHKYTRLDIAKNAISKFVSEHKNDRFWLVIFAWDAISTIPLTTDHNLFLTLLDWVDYRNLTIQWSDFQKALNLAINRFSINKDRSKALVFISDWGDDGDNINLNINIPKNINYFVVWIWTDKWGRIIKWLSAFWRYIYQKYKWNYVISKLNRNNLKEISKQLNAPLFYLNNIWDLSKLDSYLNKLEKKTLKMSANWELNNLWRTLAFFSLLFFLIYLLLYINPKILEPWKKIEL